MRDRHRSVFVKVATSAKTAATLRREIAIAQCLTPGLGARLLAAHTGRHPILIQEDLSAACWQPSPWTEAHEAACEATLAAVARITPPAILPAFAVRTGWWRKAAADPARFLAAGVAPLSWLDRCLPVLMDAETRGAGAGESLMHYDLHTANLCFWAGRAVMVDWGLAHRGNPDYDRGYLALHAHRFGGRRPASVLPDRPEIAAMIAGRLACRPWSTAEKWSSPGLFLLVREHLLEALEWATDALDLPPVPSGA